MTVADDSPQPRLTLRRWQELAVAAGCEHAGACGIAELADAGLRPWLEQGRHGEMAYLERHRPARERPAGEWPWATTALVFAKNYAPDPATRPLPNADWSCYAWGDDYHDVLGDACRVIVERLREETGAALQARWFVDTGPVSERLAAVRAGLGWIGKHSLLIRPDAGSYLFLGVILTNLTMDDRLPPVPDRCGSCTRCIDACPTDAILDGRQVDSRRCISYLTIEKRGEFTPEESAMIGSQFYGCDICQAVCPWNSFAVPAADPRLRPRDAYAGLTLERLAAMSEDDYRRLFRGSAMKRAKLPGLRRNAAAVLRNLAES